MIANDFPDEAGRLAYIAGLNAARAYLFEHSGVVTKTHSGTNSEFSRVIRENRVFSDGHRRFLGQYFPMKNAADYGSGPATLADSDAARTAIDRAIELIAAIEAAVNATRHEEETP